MLLCASGNDAEPAARPGGRSPFSDAVDNRGIDLILSAVAVDRGTRSSCDYRTDAALHRTPHEPVDQGVFERNQGGSTHGGHINQPIGIIAARMGDGQQHGKAAAGRVDEGG